MNIKRIFALGTTVLVPFLLVSAMKLTVRQTNDWQFAAPNPVTVELVAHNTGATADKATVKLNIMTDSYQPVATMSQTLTVAAKDSNELAFDLKLAPGIYRCEALLDGVSVKKFNIAYEPTAIVSLYDGQSDLRAFWDETLVELAKVAPDYKVTFLPDSSSKARRIYLVEMKSLGNVTIQGYLAVPTKKGKHPAIIYYMGYSSKPYCFKPDDNPDFVEFVLSVRGQALNEPNNIYGDWITYGLGDKYNYYYRGAFMDLVRAIDFVSSRAEVDTRHIFAEGGSQGGAFTLAAAALDNRLCAIAPWIPFLSDYPDYFKIVHWPADPVIKKQRETGLSDQELYTMLSYFDIKNLASWITCPVIMGAGLQDEVCPPHTNFSGYNRLNVTKKYHLFPTMGHNVAPEWWPERMAFYRSFMK